MKRTGRKRGSGRTSPISDAQLAEAIVQRMRQRSSGDPSWREEVFGQSGAGETTRTTLRPPLDPLQGQAGHSPEGQGGQDCSGQVQLSPSGDSSSTSSPAFRNVSQTRFISASSVDS